MEQDDFDVDWEEDNGDMDILGEDGGESDDLEIDVKDLEGGGEDGAESKEDGPATKKQKKLAVVFNMEEGRATLHRHTAFLSDRAASLNRASGTCNDEELRAITLSVLPPELVRKAEAYASAAKDTQILIMKEILTWLMNAFVIASQDDFKIVDRVDADHLQVLLALACNNEGKTRITREQLCMLGVLSFRALGILARLVSVFNPPSWKPASHSDMYEQALKRAHKDFGTSDSLNVEAEMTKWRKRHPESKLQDVTFLMEVYRGLPSVGASSSSSSSSSSSAAAAAAAAASRGSADLPISLVDDSDDEIDQPSTARSSTQAAAAFSSSSSSSTGASTEDKAGRWVHVDIVYKSGSTSSSAPARVSIDEPERVEKDLRGNRAVVYALGIENIGFVTDVSARYAMQAHKTQQGTKLKFLMWWSREIMKMNNENLAPTGLDLGTDSLTFDAILGPCNPSSFQYRAQEERTQLHVKVMDEPAPKSAAGFKKHPKYILEAHFRADFGVKPGAKFQGVFKGQRYWLRNDVVTLRSVRKWGSVMRQLKGGEKDKPAKVLSKNVGKKAPDGERRTADMNLYGEWQTEPIKVAPIVDDIIPVNGYGKIEIWDYNTALVPAGARFLSGLEYSLPDIRAACKTLGLPFADALVGFDHKAGGLTVPKVGGVVVLQKHYSVVQAATEDLGDRKEEKIQEKTQKRVLANWHKLVSLKLLREKVSHKFKERD